MQNLHPKRPRERPPGGGGPKVHAEPTWSTSQPAAPIGTRRDAALVAAVNHIYSSHINIHAAGENSALRKTSLRFVRRAHFRIMHVGNTTQLHASLFGSLSSVCLYQLDHFSTTEVVFLENIQRACLLIPIAPSDVKQLLRAETAERRIMRLGRLPDATVYICSAHGRIRPQNL